MLKRDIHYLGYLFDCILHMNIRGLFNTVEIVHKISTKNRIYLFFDILYCGFKYGAAYNDYLLFEFYLLTKNQRRTYVTRVINNKITRLMNDRAFYHLFDNKDEFYALYSEFIGRRWMAANSTSKEEFVRFLNGDDEIIIKPVNGGCGIGVEKLKRSDFKDLDSMFAYISGKPNAIVEEVIPQHEKLDELYPGSVNTLRIVTVYSEGSVNIVYAYIRIGNSERPVDNINSGGMCAPIDLESGVVTQPGYDKNRVTYEKHPKTGCKIKGFSVPMWQEALELCRKAAERVPQMGYVGWDVGITPRGPVLVEGNNLPGHDILQLPPHVPDRVGMLPRFKMYVKNL